MATTLLRDCRRSLARQCWSQDPNERPSASEIVSALENMLQIMNTQLPAIPPMKPKAPAPGAPAAAASPSVSAGPGGGAPAPAVEKAAAAASPQVTAQSPLGRGQAPASPRPAPAAGGALMDALAVPISPSDAAAASAVKA